MNNLALNLIGQGIALGFSAAVLPGPLQLYLMSTALRFGWRKALFIVASPLLVDVPIILLVLIALEAFASFLPQIVDVIRILGGCFVLFLAWSALQDLRAGRTLLDEEDVANRSTASGGAILLRGMLVNALSPGPYLFWSTVNGPLLQQGLNASLWHGSVFLLSFYGTFLSLLVALAVTTAQSRRLSPGVVRSFLTIAVGLLTVVGFWLIVRGVLGLSAEG